MTRKEMTNERAQSDVRINSAERGGIGRSQIVTVLQHKQVKERFARLLTEGADTLISDNTAVEQMQMEELMRYVRDNLSPMEQNIFRLRYLREMTCQEVAEALNVSRQTVHTHLKQSVEKIRKYFNSNSKAI